jgi:hypothetical protein
MNTFSIFYNSLFKNNHIKQFVLFVIMLTSFLSVLNAQTYKKMMYDNSINFYDVVTEAENYFNEKDKGKGSGWKGFQRWKADNEHKYYPSGNRNNVDPYFVKHQYEAFLKNNPHDKSIFSNGWEELGPTSPGQITGHYSFGMGRIVSFYVDPNNTQRLYLGTRTGGFWKSLNGGTTWANTTDFLAASGVNSITASPTNPDSVLINVNNSTNHNSHGIYRSTDGGNSWTLSNFNPTNLGWGGLGSNGQIFKIKYHPTTPNLIFIGTRDGLYRSSDNLNTWTTPIATHDFTDIDFHPTNPNIIYAYAKTNPNFFYISTDAGLTFSTTYLTGNSGGVGTVAVSPTCPNCVYFMSNNGLWKSTDTGTSFSLVSTPGESDAGFAVSDLNDNNILAGYVDGFFSTDGGLNFNQVTYWSLGNTNGAGSGHQNSYITSTDYVHADLQAAECLNGVFYACTDGFLVKSTNNGVDWTKLSEDVGIRMNYNLGISQSNHARTICGSQDNGTSINTENGWIEFTGGDGMEGLIHTLNDDWMISSYQYGSHRVTKDGGQSSTSGSVPNVDGYWITPMVYDPNNQMSIIHFTDTIYRSDDFADNWSIIGSPSFTGDIKFATIAENNSDIIVAVRDEKIELSLDGGINWSNIKNNLPSYSITDVVFDPNNDNTIIVTYGRYQSDNSKVFITYNQGTTWQNITYNLGNMPVRSVVIDHTNTSTIYLGTEIGVYKKPMTGTSWSLYNIDLPNTSIKEMEIMRGTNTLRATTWGRGLWEYSLDGRKEFPAIITTTITNPPTLATPKENVDQFVTSTISYDSTLTSVYTEWSINTPTFGNVITMSNTSGNEWRSDSPIPNYPTGTKMFFKVFAVGSTSDTTETYKFQYTVTPFEYCNASGDAGAGNLYLNSVTVNNMLNTTMNDTYTYYVDSIVNLDLDSTYAINLSANTTWSSNDYGVWIDYNKDAVFSANEAVLYDDNSGGSSDTTFTVPLNALTGDTLRMRIRLSYWGSTPDPCGTTLGEVEDYPIIINTPPFLVGSLTSTICNNDSLIINGTVYNANNPTGTEVFTNIGAANQDSIVSINLTVLAALTGVINDTICNGDFIVVNGTTYNSSVSGATQVFTNVGPYNCDSVVTINLTVLSNPIDISLTENSPTLTSNQTGAYYQWLDCNNNYAPIAFETNQSITPQFNGDYAVEITIGSCIDTSLCENISTIGITEITSNVTTIYPNPTNGIVNIYFGENNNLTNYIINSIEGKLIKQGNTNLNNISIDLSKEGKGIYFVKVKTEKTSTVYKLILQ